MTSQVRHQCCAHLEHVKRVCVQLLATTVHNSHLSYLYWNVGPEINSKYLYVLDKYNSSVELVLCTYYKQNKQLVFCDKAKSVVLLNITQPVPSIDTALQVKFSSVWFFTAGSIFMQLRVTERQWSLTALILLQIVCDFLQFCQFL